MTLLESLTTHRGTPRVRAETVLGALVCAHLLLKLVLLPFVWDADVVGDERYYLDVGRELSNLVRDAVGLRPPDVAGLERNVVGNGWFMPGMGVVLAPLFLVAPDPPMEVIRLYLGLTSTALLLVAARSLHRTLGTPYAAAVLVFPGLVPIWVLFSYAAWGDLMAGLMAVLLLTRLVEWFRTLRAGTAPTLADGVRLGLCAIAVVYLRSSAVLVAAALLLVAVAGVALLLRDSERHRAVRAFATAGAVFVAVLLPWSLAVSASMGTWVTTTTSVSNVMANTFGDRDQVCYGPCDPDSSKWFGPVRYSREVAEATGRSEVEIQKEMSSYARQDVTAGSYAEDVLGNLDEYAGEPGRFAELIRAPGIGDDWRTTAIERTSEGMFWTVAGLMVVALLSVVRRRLEEQVLSVALKLAIGALLTQPFVHICGSRYWSTAGPLWAVTVVLLWRDRHPPPALAPVDAAAGGSALLTAVQWVLVTATVVIAAGVTLLALS